MAESGRVRRQALIISGSVATNRLKPQQELAIVPFAAGTIVPYHPFPDPAADLNTLYANAESKPTGNVEDMYIVSISSVPSVPEVALEVYNAVCAPLAEAYFAEHPKSHCVGDWGSKTQELRPVEPGSCGPSESMPRKVVYDKVCSHICVENSLHEDTWPMWSLFNNIKDHLWRTRAFSANKLLNNLCWSIVLFNFRWRTFVGELVWANHLFDIFLQFPKQVSQNKQMTG